MSTKPGHVQFVDLRGPDAGHVELDRLRSLRRAIPRVRARPGNRLTQTRAARQMVCELFSRMRRSAQWDESRNNDDSPVVRAVRILAAVARGEEAMSLARLSQAVASPKTTVHRLAGILEREDLIARDPITRHYVVARGLHDLALHAMRGAPVHRSREMLLRGLSEEIGETVNLGVLSAGEVIYVERVESAWPLRMDFKPGSRVPIHCTAIGKLLLAFAPRRVRERLIVGVPLKAYTRQTITDVARLREELRITRKRGHSEDNEEFLAGVCCLAVPVRNAQGRVIAGLAVSAPSARFPLERARAEVATLQRFAGLMAAHLEAARDDRGQERVRRMVTSRPGAVDG